MSQASSFSPLSRGGRVVCTMIAAVCAVGVQVGVLGLFHQASAEPWINPSGQLQQALASCDSLRLRAEREQCTRQLVARAKAPVAWAALADAR